jgi:tetratricopeptide (TPR) repeat protein
MSGTLPPELMLLMDAAASAFDTGDLERAGPLFRQILAKNPRDAEAWHMLAVIAIRRGEAGQALDWATRAQQLDRRNHHYLNTLGIAHGETQQLEEAARWFRRALKQRPNYADGHYNLGKVHGKLGNLSEAERCYLRARELDPHKGEVANNLAALYSRQGRYRDALAFLGQARAALPNDETAVINSAIALLATAGSDAAIHELSAFTQTRPDAAAAHAELGRLLLGEGRFAEGWREYAWRRRAPIEQFPDPGGKRVLLLPDQGLGDHLFFLRYAAKLKQRAAHVAFACPTKLLGLLERNLPVDIADKGDFDLAVPLGDLPRLLDDASMPPPLAIRVDSARVAAWRERLVTLGPAPYLGVTWRGGSTREGESEFAARGEDPLYKEIDLSSLAAAIRDWPGTLLILQRLPMRGENAAFCKALGRSAHDLCAANDDLVDMAALLSLVDEYVGVSNTNMHIRAGVGKTARVLVPFPPEFRWMHSGDEVPWFPGFTVYRQSPAHDWGAALEQLTKHLND